MTLMQTRNIIITEWEDGYFVAEIPSLPWCISQGKTYDEAYHNILEAAWLYIETLKTMNKPVPQERSSIISMDERVFRTYTTP